MRIFRLLFSLLFMIWPTFAFCVITTQVDLDLYAFSQPQQRFQFQQLTQELRCLVCQNQTLADSTAPLANDLRNEIAQMIRQGENNQQIRAYLVRRYGDFVLYEPPIIASTYVLWFGPLFLLSIGLVIIIMFIWQRQRRAGLIT